MSVFSEAESEFKVVYGTLAMPDDWKQTLRAVFITGYLRGVTAHCIGVERMTHPDNRPEAPTAHTPEQAGLTADPFSYAKQCEAEARDGEI